jgi:hypothetical protein
MPKFRDVVGTSSKRCDLLRGNKPMNYTTPMAARLNDILHGIITDGMLYHSDDEFDKTQIRKTCLITRVTDFDVLVRRRADMFARKKLRKTDFASLYKSLIGQSVIDNVTEVVKPTLDYVSSQGSTDRLRTFRSSSTTANGPEQRTR